MLRRVSFRLRRAGLHGSHIVKFLTVSTQLPHCCSLLQAACSVSAQAHAEAACAAATASHEFAIEAAFLRATTAGGLRSLGYPSIVAAGPNAATLHYGRNDGPVRRGDLVLMDAGAEFRQVWEVSQELPSQQQSLPLPLPVSSAPAQGMLH